MPVNALQYEIEQGSAPVCHHEDENGWGLLGRHEVADGSLLMAALDQIRPTCMFPVAGSLLAHKMVFSLVKLTEQPDNNIPVDSAIGSGRFC